MSELTPGKVGAAFGKEMNREIEVGGSTLPLRKDAESSFLGVFFRAQSLQTEVRHSVRTLRPARGSRSRSGKGHWVPAQGRGGRRLLGSRPPAEGGVAGAARAGCSQPRDGTEIWAAVRVGCWGSVPAVTRPRRAKTGHDALGPTPSLPPQVFSASSHC